MSYVADVAKCIFGGAWKLLVGVDVPGVGVSVAAVLIAFFVIQFSINLFGFISGFSMGGGDYGRAGTTAEKYKNDRDRYRAGKSSKFDW